jgi:hypothetical protein
LPIVSTATGEPRSHGSRNPRNAAWLRPVRRCFGVSYGRSKTGAVITPRVSTLADDHPSPATATTAA